MNKSSRAYTIFQYCFYPTIVLSTLSFSFALITYFHPSDYILIPGILTLAAILVFVVTENIAPYREEWIRNKGDVLNDFLQTFVVLPSASKLAEFTIPILFYYPIIWMSNETGYLSFNNNLGIAGNFILVVLCCEFIYYWYHRFSHQIPLLWRFHSIHHAAERVYWLNSGRFHLFDAFFSSFIYFIPMVFLNVKPEVVILVLTFSSVTGFLEHVNIDFKAGWLNYIFNTAEHHRWHHSIKVVESNRNYGKILIVWDLLFRSFHLPAGQSVCEVGIQGDKISNSFFRQLIHPFNKKN